MSNSSQKAKTYSVKISQQAKHELELFCAHYGRSQAEFVSELILNYTRPDEGGLDVEFVAEG